MRSEYRLRELVSQRFMDHLERQVLKPGELSAAIDRVAAREVDPYTAADELLARASRQIGRESRRFNHEVTKSTKSTTDVLYYDFFVSFVCLRVFVMNRC